MMGTEKTMISKQSLKYKSCSSYSILGKTWNSHRHTHKYKVTAETVGEGKAYGELRAMVMSWTESWRVSKYWPALLEKDTGERSDSMCQHTIIEAKYITVTAVTGETIKSHLKQMCSLLQASLITNMVIIL